MVEQVTTHVVRCDACGILIEHDMDKATIFTKDLCSTCACILLEDIGRVSHANQKVFITQEEFLELLDDYKNSFRCQRKAFSSPRIDATTTLFKG
jgi:hypothetical protein